VAKFKVLVTDYEYKTLQEEKAVFEKIDAEFITAQCRTEEEVIKAAKDADAILNQYAPLLEKSLKVYRNVK
jgi:D-3-phosphoglycerate dehydrogenase / 2-oxoglutarate reductase